MKNITYSIFTIDNNVLTLFSSRHKTKEEAIALINKYTGEFVILEVYS